MTGNGTTLVDTTFINLVPADGILNNFTQNYSDTNPIGAGANPPFTGADVAYTGGAFFERYAIYYFGHGAGNPALNFVATGATADLVFQGINLQEVSDEFWALDNVAVTTDRVNSVPESVNGIAWFALPGILLLGRIFGKRKSEAIAV